MKDRYFTKTEIILWSASMLFIIAAFIAFDRQNYMALFSSLIGAACLIMNAKGNPIGLMLTVVFSVLYGIISFSFAYYGEMITYLGMTAPMAVAALISWLRHPYEGKRSEVAVGGVRGGEIIFMFILTFAVTILFYFLLRFFDTANLLPSTLSVGTSFLAVYLTFRRSPYFALAYAANDIVLIVLWAMASYKDTSYISVLVCFIMFLVNDIYGFINWRRMEKRQSKK